MPSLSYYLISPFSWMIWFVCSISVEFVLKLEKQDLRPHWTVSIYEMAIWAAACLNLIQASPTRWPLLAGDLAWFSINLPIYHLCTTSPHDTSLGSEFCCQCQCRKFVPKISIVFDLKSVDIFLLLPFIVFIGNLQYWLNL